MTPEIETDSSAAGSNGGDVSDVTITRASDASESSASNGGRGRDRGGCTGRGGRQGHGVRGRTFNLSAYISSNSNFKGEVDNFGAVLGTTAKKIEANYQYKNSSRI